MLCRNCGKNLLIPFARQQTILRSILQKFKELVDPPNDDIVDKLITNGVIQIGSHHDFTSSSTQAVRAHRLWEYLLSVPPRKFFETVEPTLRGLYPSMFENVEPDEDSLPQMCFRDVVMDVLPLGDIADEMCQANVIPPRDTGQFHGEGCSLTKGWQNLFTIISGEGKASEVKEIFRRRLEQCEIPVPEDLERQLAQGVPCVCEQQLLRSEICCTDCLLRQTETSDSTGLTPEIFSDFFDSDDDSTLDLDDFVILSLENHSDSSD